MVLKQIQQEAIVKPLLFASQRTDRDPKGRGDGLSLGACRPGAKDESHKEPPSTQDNSAKQPAGRLDKTQCQPHFPQAIVGTGTDLIWWVHPHSDGAPVCCSDSQDNESLRQHNKIAKS